MKKGKSLTIFTMMSALTQDSYIIAIISNQAGLALKGNAKAPAAHKARVPGFKGKVVSVFNQLNMPISVYAATEKDIFRKPRPGMWREVLKDNGISDPVDVDLGESFFVGDAGGRIAGPKFKSDFSSSDR
jgi:bifunctional polynucleotide phosphatase/kinase